MARNATSNCAFRESVRALAAGKLLGEQRAHLEVHLTQCEDCRCALRELWEQSLPALVPYTIVAELGRGAFGRVYKAFHEVKHRYEAVKVLPETTGPHTAFFQTEIHLIAQLQHPNIATLYDARLDGAPRFYAMEFVPGPPLDEHFHERRPPLAERLRTIRTVALAVAHAHERQVVHRDLKPQNILIDTHGEPHIVDFGIARRLGPDEAHGADQTAPGALGTQGYMAPEQAAGEPGDVYSDIYSLGALLHAGVLGDPPRPGDSAIAIAARLRRVEIARPEDLAAIIARCCAVNPRQRYENARAVAEEIDAYVAGRPVEARGPEHRGYVWSRVTAVTLQQHPLALHAAGFLLTVALLTTLLLFFSARRTSLLAPGAGESVSLIGMDEATVAAIERGEFGEDLPALNSYDVKSWRLLHGRLLELLAEADPRAVVYDIYFPDCQPEFDAALLRGVELLRAPLVVAAARFDINGEPEMCADLRQRVQGWGSIAVIPPGRRSFEAQFPVCIERGNADPISGLAVAGFAAARHPDAIAEVRPQPGSVDIKYRKRDAAKGERRWHEDRDEVALLDSLAGEEIESGRENFEAGDVVHLFQASLQGREAWRARTHSLVDVIRADTAQRLQWFRGRVVLVGRMQPGRDEYSLASGAALYGCEVQAQALAALLAREQTRVFTAGQLAVRAFAGALVGWGLMALAPLAWLGWRRGWIWPAVLCGIAVAPPALSFFPRLEWIALAEVVIAIEALLVGACACALLRWQLYRARQLEGTPVMAIGA